MSTFIATAVAFTAFSVSGAANTRLGCNAQGFGMGRNFFSADVVKQSTFGSIYSPTTQNVSVDQVGWPTEDFAALLYSEPGGYIYPGADISGVYTVTAAGCASVASAYPGAVVLNSTCPPGGPLLAYVQVSDNATLVNGRFGLLFTQTVRAGGGAGLTNVSVLQPGFPVGTDPETFTPAAINQFRRCSLIRFLGMTLVGHTQWDDHTPPSSADWSARPRVGAPSYFLGGWGINGGGAPWETAAALSNAVGADMWVNVPSTSNETMRDDYLVQLVTLLDKVLAPGQRIFIEWGNECFFGNNQCYQDDVQTANDTVLHGNDPHRLNYGLQSPPNASNLLVWGSRMYAYNARNIAIMAASVVGAARVGRADMPGVRVVPVLGALGSYAEDLENKASWLNAAWGSPAASGLATVNIGAYVGSDPSQRTSAAAVVQSLLDTIANASTTAATAYGSNPLAEFAASSAYWGLALHAYEGGPDTSGGTADTLMPLADANKDPRMTDVVTGIVRNWQSWGGGMFNFFIIGAQPLEQPWGSYSDLWDMKVTTTPKSLGLDSIISTPPAPVTAGWPIPVLNHSASFFVGYYSANKLPSPNPVLTWLPPGSHTAYLVRGASACSLGLNVTVLMSNFIKGGQSDPLGVSVGAFLPPMNVTAPATDGSERTFVASSPALFPPMPAAALPNDLIAVRLQIVTAVAPKFSLLGLYVTCRTS